MAAEENVKGGVKVEATFGEASSRAQTARPHIDAPFRLTVVGDFGGDGSGRAVEVTAAELADLGTRLGAKVDLVLPNRLGSSPPSLSVSVPIRTLRDLDPKTLEARVDPIQRARKLLAEAESGVLPYEIAPDPAFDHLHAALSARSQAPVTPSATGASGTGTDDGSLDRLLGLVDVPGQSPPPSLAKSAVAAFVGSISKSDRPRPSAGTSEAARLVAEQSRDLVGHPGWLAVEAAWRCLRHIAAAQDLQHVRIVLRDLRRDAIPDRLTQAIANDPGEATQHRRGAILVLGAFGSSGKDLEALDRLALAGQSLGEPVIVSLDQAFFGAAALSVAAMDNPAALLDGSAFASWRGLRDRPESRFLFAAWNDVLLRPSVGESPDLWGEPGFVVAAQILRSLSRSGWPSEILGSGTALGGFDVAEVAQGAGRVTAIPLRSLVDPGTARDLGRAGVICLVCRPDRDLVWLPGAACVHGVGANGEPAHQKAMETFHSLAFLLASQQIEDLLSRHASALRAQPSPRQVAEAVSDFLTDALLTTGPGASAHAEIMPPEEGDAHDALRLEISVQFGRSVLGGFAFSLDLVL